MAWLPMPWEGCFDAAGWVLLWRILPKWSLARLFANDFCKERFFVFAQNKDQKSPLSDGFLDQLPGSRLRFSPHQPMPDGRAHGYGKFKAANGNIYEGDWYQAVRCFCFLYAPQKNMSDLEGFSARIGRKEKELMSGTEFFFRGGFGMELRSALRIDGTCQTHEDGSTYVGQWLQAGSQWNVWKLLVDHFSPGWKVWKGHGEVGRWSGIPGNLLDSTRWLATGIWAGRLQIRGRVPSRKQARSDPQIQHDKTRCCWTRDLHLHEVPWVIPIGLAIGRYWCKSFWVVTHPIPGTFLQVLEPQW